MPSVLLAHGGEADPVGERALAAAFAAALPGYEIRGVHPGGLGRGSSALRRADAFVVAGETLFGTGAFAARSRGRRREARGLLSAVAGVAPVASALHTPVLLVGVGAGQLHGAIERRLASYLVRRAALVLLADEGSAQILANAGAPAPLRIGADPVWAALGAPSAEHGLGDVVAVVLDAAAGPACEDDLAATLRVVKGEGFRIRLQPWAGPPSADMAMARRLADALGPGRRVDIADPPYDLGEARELLADARVVLSLRFRAIQAAAQAGVPVVAVACDARTASLARRLGQRALAPGGLVPGLAAALADAAAGPVPSPSAVKEEMARAEAGFALARLVIEGGRSEVRGLETLPLGPEPWLS